MNEEKELGGSFFRCPLYDEDISKEDCDSTVQLIKNGRVPRGGEGEWLTEKDVTERSAICLKCPHNENMLFERALNHVIACQSGQIQWGTGRPAVLLALEALQVLQSMRADVPLLIGGLMYSGDVGTEEIEDLFGTEILQLVAPYDLAPEEDHLKAWEASQKAIRESDHRHKLIVLADLVAALRALWRDVEELGDAVWERFQFPMEDLSWYYSGLMDALLDLEQDETAKPVYWEASALFKDIFVSYWGDFERGVLYEAPEGLEVFGLTKDECRWMPINELPKELQEVSPDAIPMRRWDVEEILDLWLSEKDKAQR